ncbi:MAG: hypothetical protein EXR43_03265 [Dehalococcoidia bacterium]|nr:hypothetical protein [Dehalococcoidia bacterium]
MQGLPIDRGHVRIELTKLAKNRRWNLEVLKRSLSNTYRTLLSNGRVRITVGPEEIKPVDIPLSTATKSIVISPIKLSGDRSAQGWAGRMMRNQLTRQQKAGMRLVLNGRLIKEGEWFGYNYQGKGSLNSLIGELDLKNFKPSPNKTDFVDAADVVWEELGDEVVKQLQPLISELRRVGEETRVTKEEKGLVREVAAELGEVLKALSEGDEFEESLPPVESVEAAPGGRKRAKAGLPREPVKNPRGPNKNPHTPRTSPPEDPVGSINRLLARINEGKGQPPLRIRGWDETERSTWTTEGTQAWLDINKNYPLFVSLRGRKPYLAETAVLELCKPREGEALSAAEYIGKVDLMLFRWSQLNTEE